MKKLIVITGASSGFGKEMALHFSAAGHPLLLLARRTAPMLALNLPNTLVKEVDVTNFKAFEAAIHEAESIYGKVDLLVNNAGLMLLGNIWTQDPAEWQTMLNVNVQGVLNGSKIVLADMMARNEGSIINVSSIAGKKTFGNHAAYSATKYGVHALTETIREEVSATNVRVMLVAPGAAETELLQHTTDNDIKEGYNEWKETMGGISLDPKHVANSVKFMYDLPQEVSIRELVIAATKQGS
ncbi:oxidoreductase [Brochothrix thermosphacta]|uniref:SDR family oxidoreductase n=1 Tax=Brochothrix thermosphacta TaxID=2756 RepID=UPI000E73F603|nr:SDR family oxidoreductase [Brochothrix thermosphacta]ANZ97789.1 oxidoreductase [Brochothrix thermosphacta]